MEENIYEAIWLLIVGMGSVFLVLFLIGFMGKNLIRWVNTFPEKETHVNLVGYVNHHKISQKQLVVLTSVVEEITEGAGCITNIQKIEF